MADPRPTDDEESNVVEFWRRALWILEVVTPGTRVGSSRFHALGRPTLLGRKLSEHVSYMASAAAARERVTVFVADRTTMANELIWWIVRARVLQDPLPATLPDTRLMILGDALRMTFGSFPQIHAQLLSLAKTFATDRDALLTDQEIRENAISRIQKRLS